MNAEMLSISKETVLAIHRDADAGGKAAFVKAFGPKLFFSSITEWEDYIIPRVTSFETACAELGLDPSEHQYADREPDEASYAQGKIVARALNPPFITLSWADGDQKKWEAWMKYGPSGFRLNVVYFGCASAYTTSGSRLCLCSERLARHFAITFGDLMKAFWDFDQ